VVFTYGKITNPSWGTRYLIPSAGHHSRVRTRRPTNARTVSLLLSLALRSPISPEPMAESEAKCIVTAALEPPATIPQSAREQPLRHKAVIRIPEPKSRPVNVWANLSSWGDRTSRTMAMSFRMSARKRYVFASGNREVPNKYAKMIAVYVINSSSTRKGGGHLLVRRLTTSWATVTRMASVAEADCLPTPKPSRTALEANKLANELQHA